MNGKNNFPVMLSVSDIVEITDIAEKIKPPTGFRVLEYTDLQTACIVLALSKFLEERRCVPGFRLEIE